MLITVIQTEPICLILVLYLFDWGYVTHPDILKWLNQSNMNGYSYLKRMLKTLATICAFVKKAWLRLFSSIAFLQPCLKLSPCEPCGVDTCSIHVNTTTIKFLRRVCASWVTFGTGERAHTNTNMLPLWPPQVLAHESSHFA